MIGRDDGLLAMQRNQHPLGGAADPLMRFVHHNNVAKIAVCRAIQPESCY